MNNLDKESLKWNKVYENEPHNLPWFGLDFPIEAKDFLSSLDKDKLLLVPGCGAGDSAKILASMGFSQVFGTDISRIAIERAKSRFPGIAFETLATEEISIREKFRDINAFDWLNLHQVSDIDPYLGSLAAASENLCIAWISDSMEIRTSKSYVHDGNIYFHSPAEVRDSIEKNGMKLRKEFSFSFKTNPAAGDIREHQAIGQIYEKTRKGNMLVIGGTGIVGLPIVNKLVSLGNFNVHTIALGKADIPETVRQHLIDRKDSSYEASVRKINDEVGYWDGVIDAFAFDGESARQTRDLFKDCAGHIITVSTTLVYDRSVKNAASISEETPLAHEGTLGGYVDGKLGLEKFWKAATDANWTLLRPYHILGAGSLLGCVPEHNRDPKLIERLKAGEPLRLCNGGDIEFNYIHPNDIALAVSRIIGNKKAFGQAYNLVNPAKILARDYYQEIANQVGGTLNIEPVSMEEIWEGMKGWEMTTLPHLYSMKKLENDTGFVPSIPLREGVRDAIASQPQLDEPIDQVPIHQRMNKLPRPQKISWLFE